MGNAKNASGRLAGGEFTVTRVIDAPRDVVFRAWTEADRLKNWWGPKGFTTASCRVDLRPGGMFHYCMRSPEGRDYWGRGVYREIVRNACLVYLDSFSDEKGGLVEPEKYGMGREWPAEALTTVLFEEENGRTRLVIKGGVPAELAERAQAAQGWREMLDRLAEYAGRVPVR